MLFVSFFMYPQDNKEWDFFSFNFSLHQQHGFVFLSFEGEELRRGKGIKEKTLGRPQEP